MPDEIVITGLTETRRVLVELPVDLTRNGMQKALIAGSIPLQEELLENAPRRQRAGDQENEFPSLIESLVTDVEVRELVGVASTGFGEAGPVANWNEYGHRIVTHAKVDTGKTTEPNPFMRRTTDHVAERVIDEFCDSLLLTVKDQYGS